MIARMDWQWSFDSKVSWKLATQIVATTALQNGLECYETSSIHNPKGYEESIMNLAANWGQPEDDKKRVFTRIFCFDDKSIDKQDTECKNLFHQILDPRRDSEGQYTKIRECIRMGKMRILHLPYRILTDYLVIRTENDSYNCLLSFAPPANEKFLASAHIRDKAAGARLLKHIEHIMALAEDNCRINATGQNSTCSCGFYQFNQQTHTLVPSF